jgi:hypothetical protein
LLVLLELASCWRCRAGRTSRTARWTPGRWGATPEEAAAEQRRCICLSPPCARHRRRPTHACKHSKHFTFTLAPGSAVRRLLHRRSPHIPVSPHLACAPPPKFRHRSSSRRNVLRQDSTALHTSGSGLLGRPAVSPAHFSASSSKTNSKLCSLMWRPTAPITSGERLMVACHLHQSLATEGKESPRRRQFSRFDAFGRSGGTHTSSYDG